MTLGPIEVVVLGFPGSRFTGEIRPQIIDLVKRGIVSVVDALLIKKDQAGAVTFVEMQQLTGDAELEALASEVSGQLDLLSDEDVDVVRGRSRAGLVGVGDRVRAHLDEAGTRRSSRLRWRPDRRHPRSRRGRRRGTRRRPTGLNQQQQQEDRACLT